MVIKSIDFRNNPIAQITIRVHKKIYKSPIFTPSITLTQ